MPGMSSVTIASRLRAGSNIHPASSYGTGQKPAGGGFREDFRGVTNLDAIRNSYRLTVTVESQSMMLTQDRPQACPFHRAQAVADPQGQAMQHLPQVAMRAAMARPVVGNADFTWDRVG